MRKRFGICSRFSLFSLCLLFLAPVGGSGTLESQGIVASYHDVLDRVFSRERPGLWRDRDVRLVLSLRFQPSFHTESQVTIVGTRDGFEVIKHSIPSNEPSIWSRLYKLSSQSHSDLDEFVKNIQIDIEKRKLPTDKGNKLLEEFSSLRVSPNAGRSDVLDGIGYHIFYETFGTRFVMAVSNPDVKKEPLFRWVEAMRNEFGMR